MVGSVTWPQRGSIMINKPVLSTWQKHFLTVRFQPSVIVLILLIRAIKTAPLLNESRRLYSAQFFQSRLSDTCFLLCCFCPNSFGTISCV